MAIIGMMAYAVVLFGSLNLTESVQKGVIYISPFVRLIDFVFGILLGLDFLKLREKPDASLKMNKLGGGNFCCISRGNNFTCSRVLSLRVKVDSCCSFVFSSRYYSYLFSGTTQ